MAFDPLLHKMFRLMELSDLIFQGLFETGLSPFPPAQPIHSSSGVGLAHCACEATGTEGVPCMPGTVVQEHRTGVEDPTP